MCGVIHSLYTAGHAPLEGDAAYDVDACAEAIRLAELLHALLPEQPMPTAVLALLLLTEARRPARLDAAGDMVTLDLQDRAGGTPRRSRAGSRCSTSPCALGGRPTRTSCRPRSPPSTPARRVMTATDWREILRLYDLLMSVAPNDGRGAGPGCRGGRGAGAAAGLALLADLPHDPPLACRPRRTARPPGPLRRSRRRARRGARRGGDPRRPELRTRRRAELLQMAWPD